MGIIMGLEVTIDAQVFLPDLINRQILSAYQMARLLSIQWSFHGFPGHTQEAYFILPKFSETIEED